MLVKDIYKKLIKLFEYGDKILGKTIYPDDEKKYRKKIYDRNS
ncbi:MAG TPA: hypothetical protein VN368_03560 [Candidatus Methylomirabilis sp.]|nr:hypothetical protein [Candidatus Methylomirabilis sp.]